MTPYPVQILMPELCEIIRKMDTFKPRNVVEVGSMHGYDADYLAKELRIDPQNVVIYEPHPAHYEAIRKRYPIYDVRQKVVGAKPRGEVAFYCVDLYGTANKGTSSVLERKDGRPENYFNKMVEGTSLKADIQGDIDVLKIDVEGATHEVLRGAGLERVKLLHIECEHVAVWKGQKLYGDIEGALIGAGFICVAMRMAWPQSDSVWIRKDLYRAKWWK